MNRHNARILAVLSMYNIDVCNVLKEEQESILMDVIQNELDEEYPVEFDKEYTISLVKGCLDNIENVDSLLSASLVGYTLDRLSYVDRAIVRIATYEMKYLNVPKNIAINEALEITKDYSNMEDNLQVKFTNSLLDHVAKAIYG